MWRLRSLFLVAALLVSAAGLAEAQKFTPRDESPEEFPAGPGREETFYACTACHGFKLIAAQGMNRRQWDETLTFMTSRHGMPNLEGKDRELVLNYLETTYPPRAPTGGWQNPFLKR
jgi:mono/diheme cytochrome c family protein